MEKCEIKRQITIPKGSVVDKEGYRKFLVNAYKLMSRHSQYFAPSEDINSLELAHLIPKVAETVIAIYVGINDATCNKGLVTPILTQHGHNNIFVFDPNVYPGGSDVPAGTKDAKLILNGFEPPNNSWNRQWTYVMISDPGRTFQSLWSEKGYIDMIPAKFEDFTMLSDMKDSKVCFFVDEKAFEHPVNREREYLRDARQLGEKMADEFKFPELLKGETDGLVPVILDKGQKLYIARKDNAPCAHAWSNLHPDNKELAVVNENSAVPLDLVIAKPVVDAKYSKGLVPAKGSADMTTDWFYRGKMAIREPLLTGLVPG